MGFVMAIGGGLMILGIKAVYAYMAVFLLLSAAIVAVSANYTVILQKTVENDMAGRVFGIVGSIGNFTLPISVLLFGCILKASNLGAIATGCGAAILLVCMLLALLYKNQKVQVSPLPRDVQP